ncbi:MAG: response regulator transcription factor [Candidatus Eremiobacteraeota bacterium]|nr:response regulator transcription factor [Candidatus Eremiobacteraeota bacterium]MBV8354590.1 response regulator transcription factor [Candidatus Eremiobacteraeota bacterium]
MAEGQAARVVVVDDERHVREMLEVGLSQEGYTVKSAADGQQALALVREWPPDAIVLDVMMPKVDGITLLPMLRKLTDVPVIMLSAKGDVGDRIEGLRGGADDYLPKPFEFAELLARLETALRRPRLAKPQSLRFADLGVDLEARRVTRDGRRIDLSMREYDLLVTLMRSPNRVFTREQLLDLVWGSDREVGTGTVETYISYLRAKIDTPPRPRLIHTVRGVGYVLREE